MITFTQKGDFKNSRAFMKALKDADFLDALDKYGQQGVEALRRATPKDTGATADAWDYTIKRTSNSVSIQWTNSNAPYGVPVAILIQYGHGTRNGGYVEGIDYINPALKPIFEEISEGAWREVTRL